MDRDRFLQQLRIVLNPQQGSVQDATGVLQREFYDKPEALLFLVEIAISYDDTSLKQLAAVEARSLVSKHWANLPAQQKPQVREQLLRATLNDATSIVRHSCARLVSAIARLDIADGEWSDLPGTLAQSALSSNKDERAIAVYVLYTILETTGEQFQEKFEDIMTLFNKTIRDSESAETRTNTLLGLSKLADYINAEEHGKIVAAFQNIFPTMVGVLEESLDDEDETRAMQGFDVFQNLLTCEPQIMNPHLKDLVRFMCQIAGNTAADEDSRTQAINFLMQCTRYRKLKLQGLQLGESITLLALQVATELGDSETDGDDITPARSALGLLDLLAQTLPPSQVIVPLLHALGRYFNSQDPPYRRAGIVALGMCVEGAPDFISTQMKEIFPAVVRLLEDAEPKVRQATLQTVARLADDLPEDVAERHEQLVPLLVQNLANALQHNNGEETGPTADIIKASVAAIDSVVDGMDEKDVILYQAELVPALQQLFGHPNYKIKALSASALGSVASSAGEAFIPYFDQSMHLMQDYATKKESEEELELRASVTDAMGEMATAAGPEHFKQYVEPLMRASEEALQLDHSKLKESTYILWGNIATVYGTEFKPFLDGVVKGLFACLDQEEGDLDVSLSEAARKLIGQEVTVAGQKTRLADVEEDDDDDNIEDVDLDDDDWQDLAATTPIALEKEIAVEVIGNVVTQTKEVYLPYFEKTIEQILPLVDHTYEGVRKATIGTLHRSYATLWQVSEETGRMDKWKPGNPMVEPPAELKKLSEILMTATTKMWLEETDGSTVAEINRNLAENLKFCGPYLISNKSTLDEVVSTVEAIVTKQHVCQIDFAGGEDDEDDLDELSEFDWVVIDTALDVVCGLAIALGADFIPIWPRFEKIVLQFIGGSESLERATAVGVVAEVITGLGDAVTPYTNKFLQVLSRRLSDEDMQTRSNAVYAIGKLVEKSSSDQEIVAAYPSILEKLEACLQIRESGLPDNAAGCLGRMILKHRDSVPVADALPALLNILPLSKDFEENEPVYRMICQMYKWEDQTIRDLTQRLIPIFQSVLTGAKDQLESEQRAELIDLVSWLNKVQPGAADWIEQVSK